jgi:prophage tail gpP-like protein
VIKLLVEGFAYEGWKAVRVTRGIESLAGYFELSVSDRWAQENKAWPIGPEDECQVVINDTKIITGHVDRRSHSISASDHTLTVAGRDLVGDLIDCSAQLDKWEFANISVLKFAEKLCAPYGIRVTLQDGVSLPKSPGKLSIDPGETASEALEKACRLSAVLPVSDGLGGLLLTRVGTDITTTALVEGVNILTASADYDGSSRFHTYKVLGQHKGSDTLNGTVAASVKGTAEDLNVKRTARTMLVRPEGNVTAEHAKARAQWEATVRAARAETVTVMVQGWSQADGTVWPVNALAKIKCPSIGIDGVMLVTTAEYTLDDSGTLTRLTLRRPDAFKPEPTIKKTSETQWKEVARGV